MYGVGVVVTIVLSNDATAVVLTPAVAAAVRAAKAKPMPYLFACALVANAASFTLPISNPANLVIFGHDIPPLATWLATFAFPSLASIAITYLVMLVLFRNDLKGGISQTVQPSRLSRTGLATLGGIAATALALVVASSLGVRLGLVTSICAAVVFAIVASFDRTNSLRALRSVSWTVLVLVVGLFVLVAAAERTGLLVLARHALRAGAHLPEPLALAAVALGTGAISNIINNLPAGLVAGTTVTAIHVEPALRAAVAIGIDLGPNLSVTGSLATILWLVALRRERIEIDAWRFLRVGAVAMPLALVAAVESLLLTFR